MLVPVVVSEGGVVVEPRVAVVARPHFGVVGEGQHGEGQPEGAGHAAGCLMPLSPNAWSMLLNERSFLSGTRENRY